MNRDDEFESDLDVIRELLQRHGFQQFENMVQIAGRSRKCMFIIAVCASKYIEGPDTSRLRSLRAVHIIIIKSIHHI